MLAKDGKDILIFSISIYSVEKQLAIFKTFSVIKYRKSRVFI